MKQSRFEADKENPDKTNVFIGSYKIGWIMKVGPTMKYATFSYFICQSRYHPNKEAARKWLRREAQKHVDKYKLILKELGELQ